MHPQNLKRDMDSLCESPRTPQSAGYFKCQTYLIDRLKELGVECLEHHFWVNGYGDCVNIYTEFGNPSKPRVLIGAHYESTSFSGLAADDNASAVAVLLALTPLLKESKDHSFTIVFFDMEEIHRLSALRGSRAFARWYQKPIERVIVLDTVGGSFAPGFENMFLQFGPAFPEMTHPGYKFLHLPMKVVEPFGSMGARSDYDEFRRKGIPFTFISAGTPWYYHTQHDTLDKVSLPKLEVLTHAIADSLKSPLPELSGDGNWKNFEVFVETLAKVKPLQKPRLINYLKKRKIPNRFQVALLYLDVLPVLRKFKEKLWDAEHRA